MPDHVTPRGDVVDLFAGPGGWDLACLLLGIEPLGIEWDDAACATRRAAGLRTLQADVAALDPVALIAEVLCVARLWGLIASPPCQGFSMGGKGLGRAALAVYVAAIARMMAGEQIADLRDDLDAACADERAHLVLEPLRWALALRPEWIALEQVPPVLPLWEAMAAALRTLGYSVWTGVLSAERYGVPQTRQRAILLASSVRTVGEPRATHRTYFPPRRKAPQDVGLFDAPEPERIEVPEERHLLPWVSMADALGWRDGVTLDHHRGAGMTALDEDPRAWAFQPTNDRDNVTRRAADEPAPALAFGHNWPRWVVTDTGNTRGGSRPEGRTRGGDEPAVSITSRADQLERRTTVVEGDSSCVVCHHGDHLHDAGGYCNGCRARCDWPTAYDSRGQRDGRTRELNRQRSTDEPAPTIAGESRNDSWVFDRPATTVNGDPRISEPGWRGAPRDYDADGTYIGKRSMDNAIRVSVDEAAVLQSFPLGYPWQGSKTKMFEQVGNAVPPLLGRAALVEVLG